MQVIKRVFTQIHTRKLDRSVAHRNMERSHIRHVNRHDYSTYKTMSGMTVQEYIPSYFARHWRDYVDIPTVDLRRSKHEELEIR